MKPFIKWAGGKSGELGLILEACPEQFDRYIEPFVGGGAVYLGVGKRPSAINDKSEYLIQLWRSIKQHDEAFFVWLENIAFDWDILTACSKDCFNKFEKYKVFSSPTNKKEMLEFLITNKIAQEQLNLIASNLKINQNLNYFRNVWLETVASKIVRANKLRQNTNNLKITSDYDNLECGYKASYYTYLRYLCNHTKEIKMQEQEQLAIFYFVREYCYSAMFRYNQAGEFNVPYGGISYNKKNFRDKVSYIKDSGLEDYLSETSIYCEDFEEFLDNARVTKDDFVFLDPPYDSEFSTYSNNSFGSQDHLRLCEYLKNMDCKFLMVIKATEFIKDLYCTVPYFNTSSFSKQYTVSFKNRNNKLTSHLIVKNY